ncbi:YesL family protein [Sporosarcina sp. 6E9]|uniref:YesL family protein n=1 Tax=Sporosarcina sp. 6E9 TaxID=2819235 RepID=UPI001FF08EB3|nr:DUF624 domain-containing protein [Sporosarcina sp. 6E9]
MNWESFNNIAHRMIELIYINILWILFTILGLGIFGIFPATVSMFTIVRKIIVKEEKFKIFNTFWRTYHMEFMRTNGFAIIFYLVGYFLYYDLQFLQLNVGKFQFLYPVLILIFFSGLITLLFFFPVYVHFKLSYFQYLKQSFLIALTSPIEVITIALTGVSIYIVVSVFPGMIPLFPGSIFAYIVTRLGFRAFTRIAKRQTT